MNILWTDPAEVDLDSIVDHTLEDDPHAALSVFERIREQVGRATTCSGFLLDVQSRSSHSRPNEKAGRH